MQAGSDEYHALRLDLGVPEGDDFGSDKMFALDGDLDELHAVSFDKGCYVGQELTARMKHRGTARKRLLTVATHSGIPLVRDAPVTAGGRRSAPSHRLTARAVSRLSGWTGWRTPPSRSRPQVRLWMS